MSRFAFVLSLMLALAGIAAEQNNMPSEELEKLLARNEVIFLDVRESKELDEHGTVEGYIHIPIGQLESRLSELPKDKVIVTACQRGGRASKAAELLKKNGYHVAGSCGMAEWKGQKSRKIVKPNS
jgi:rhodanese-related sulfurtransferase